MGYRKDVHREAGIITTKEANLNQKSEANPQYT
jgi:hypothetical protein